MYYARKSPRFSGQFCLNTFRYISQNSRGYFSGFILQLFATKSCAFTNFKNFFQDVVKAFIHLD